MTTHQNRGRPAGGAASVPGAGGRPSDQYGSSA